jgi:hypothetical protein
MGRKLRYNMKTPVTKEEFELVLKEIGDNVSRLFVHYATPSVVLYFDKRVGGLEWGQELLWEELPKQMQDKKTNEYFLFKK